MKKFIELAWERRQELLALAFVGLFLVVLAGCGSGPMEASATEEAAIAAALEEDSFFEFGLTATDDDQDAAEEAVLEAEPYGAPLSASFQDLPGGIADLPRFWWRGEIECLRKDYDISISGDTASVTVTQFLMGNFFVVDEVGDILTMWEKPFEDTVIRHAEFIHKPWGWKLIALSPVELTLTDHSAQTVWIGSITASVHDAIVWSAENPATLFSVPERIPAFSPGEEVLVEAEILRTGDSIWQPSEFVFLHRPGRTIFGRRARDIMFDDGTNGDRFAGDGIYSRTYTIGPHAGRHFAAVDVIDAATFMEQNAPYNSGAWGMPYIVE
jgi:hypothetical protein